MFDVEIFVKKKFFIEQEETIGVWGSCISLNEDSVAEEALNLFPLSSKQWKKFLS